MTYESEDIETRPTMYVNKGINDNWKMILQYDFIKPIRIIFMVYKSLTNIQLLKNLHV